MEKDKLKALGKILVEKTLEGMKSAAQRYGLLTDGKIDLRGCKVRFDHSGLDLRQFLLEGCDLSGSRLTNTTGQDVRFDRCILRKVRIDVDKGKKASFAKASFNGAVFDDSYLGPRTLDLSGTSYREAKMNEVTFMLGKLEEADFTGADLKDVYFRSAELRGASFRNATLTRVSFERAILERADFSDATFVQMDFWGEPDYDGAIVSDDLRYSFGVVRDPRRKIDALIARADSGPELTEALRRLRDRYAGFLAHPEVLLIGSEMQDAVPPHLFPSVLKALKNEP